jgi:uncharacterized protein (TIGR02001 family)
VILQTLFARWAAILIPTAVLAAQPADAAGGFNISGNVTVATEGIGRGFSVTLHKPFYAVGLQAQSNGFYALVTTDRFDIAGASEETYAIAGYAHQLGKLTVDASVVRYFYNTKGADFWEGAIALRYPVGPVTVEVAGRGSVDYFLHEGHALYTYANVSAPVWEKSGTSIALSARLGREEVQRNAVLGAPDWLYWNTGVSLHRKAAVFDLTYHDTNIPKSLGLPAGPRLVGTVTVGF